MLRSLALAALAVLAAPGTAAACAMYIPHEIEAERVAQAPPSLQDAFAAIDAAVVLDAALTEVVAEVEPAPAVEPAVQQAAPQVAPQAPSAAPAPPTAAPPTASSPEA